MQKVYATYGIGIYFTDTIRYDLSHGSTNRFRTPIFLMEHKISARRLALEAGVTPVTVTRVLSRERKDMVSAKADALRDAMSRIAAPNTPSEPEEVSHAD